MIQVNDLDLLTGRPFPIPGIGTYRAPKLEELNQHTGIGLEKYNMMLSLFSMTANDIIGAVGLSDKFAVLSEEEKRQFTPFLLITSIPAYRELLREALDFFMVESVVFYENSSCFVLSTDGGVRSGTIRDDNFDDLRFVIMKANCLSVDNLLPPKRFRGKRSKAVFEKIQAARQRKQAASPDESFSICNVISSVSARHNSYNLLNIWRLTVYQLYDQFSKINLNHQIDVSALRWAAWGQDAFDFSLWYQSTKNKEETK